MEHAAADSVGQGRVTHVGVPLGAWQLACEDRRALLVTVREQRDQVGALGVGDGGQSDVGDHPFMDARVLGQESSVAAIEACEPKLLEQTGSAAIKSTKALSAGLLGEGACDICLSYARWPRD
jgi:hypothetical protein